MHKNKIIKEYTKQKIEGIIPYKTCHHKGGRHHNHPPGYRVYLRQDVIEDSFDTNATDNFQMKIPKIDFEHQFGDGHRNHEYDEEDDLLTDRCEKEDDCFHHLIMDHKSVGIQCWDILDTACSLVSGYFYAWISCFGIANEYYDLLVTAIIFEVIFSISIMLRFVTDYTPAGEN